MRWLLNYYAVATDKIFWSSWLRKVCTCTTFHWYIIGISVCNVLPCTYYIFILFTAKHDEYKDIKSKPNQPGIYKNNYSWDSNPCPQRTSNNQGFEVTAFPIRGKGLEPLGHCGRVFVRANSHIYVNAFKPPTASFLLISTLHILLNTINITSQA